MKSITELFTEAHSAKAVYKSYCPVYDKYFAPLRDTAEAVLELGILEGVSLRIMREYFTKAHIHGIDSNLKYIFQEERITCHKIHTTERESLMNADLPQFDIIIDDASHLIVEQLFAVSALWKFLKPGGLFIVEDIQPPYLRCFDCFGAELFTGNKSQDDAIAIIKKHG